MKLSTRNLLFITLISSLLLLDLVLIKQQDYSTNAQTLALTDYQPKAVPPITQIKNKELSCSDCTAQGKDTICFNVEANRATCGNVNSSQNINTLCRKCSSQPIKPSCTPRPPCLDQAPRCVYKMEPIGGWCPRTTIFPTKTPTGCYYMMKNNMCSEGSANCAKEEKPILVCPSISPKPTISQKYCLQVMTPARNLSTKECKTFSNSCIPEGWTKDSACSETPPSDQYPQ